MNLSIHLNRNIITFGLPLTIILVMVWLANSTAFQQKPGLLSSAIVLDLTLTVPLLYFFLIRKRNIPKTTVVSFFIAGLLIASYIIPEAHQSLLDQIKTWALPLVELALLFFVSLKIHKIQKKYKTNKNVSLDFYTAMNLATREVLPEKAAVFLATEIAVIYYGFVHWKRRKLASHEFSYHKDSGTVAILAILMVIVLVETFVIHILLQRWSPLAAWILSAASLYTVIQVFGILRSLSKRPISIENGYLELRYGILGESTIPLENIGSFELSFKDITLNEQIRKLSPLGDLDSHNVLIHVKNESLLKGLYGRKKTFKTLALHIDDQHRFARELQKAIENKS
jgi:hypothetical protein